MLSQHKFDQILEGMEVYAVGKKFVGIVAAFRAGEDHFHGKQVDEETMLMVMAEALGNQRDFPASLYLRLYESGFVRVRRAVSDSYVFVFPEQIGKIEDNVIYLKIGEHELLEG
jgi:hypothetical protein